MSLSDDFDSIGSSSSATPRAGAGSSAPQPAASGSLSAQFDATPTNSTASASSKGTATSSPSSGVVQAAKEVGRQIGLTARAGGNALAGAVDLVGAPLNATVNAIGSAIGHDPQLHDPGSVIRAIVDRYTPAPANQLEAVINKGAEGMAGSAAGLGVSRLAAGAANPIIASLGAAGAQAPAAQIIAGGSGGAASAAAAAAGASPLAQMAAGVVGGAAGYGGAALAGNALSRAIGTSNMPIAQTQGAIQPSLGQVAAADKPRYRPNGDGTFTEVPNPAQSKVPAAAPPPRTTAGVSPSTQAGAQQAAAPLFEVPPSVGGKAQISPSEQQANIDVMREIGLPTQRPSAITGDKFSAGQEYQQSKLDTQTGDAMRTQLANEQAAIKKYAQGVVTDTGATADTPEAVGQAIRAPLQGLSQHYDDAIGALYKAADDRAGGAPAVQPTSLTKLIADPDFRETLLAKDQQGLLGSVERQLDRFQGTAADGSGTAPNTVQSAERFRQWLNQIWTPQNSQTIGKLKEALDTDVTKSAGEDIYGAARALHAERKNTLDNPKGISSLLNESGPDGINKQVPDEKVAARVLAMPTAQLKHVVDTVGALPPSLAPQGQQALSEIKGAIARQIYKSGDSGGTQNGPSMWNAAAVTKQLNAQSSKMALLFSPEELTQFQTLNRAGHILQTPSAYPGAAVQGHNLLQKGLIWAPPAAGAALGGHLFGWEGSALGSALGGTLSARAARAADAAQANRLIKAMSNPQVVNGQK